MTLASATSWENQLTNCCIYSATVLHFQCDNSGTQNLMIPKHNITSLQYFIWLSLSFSFLLVDELYECHEN